MRFPSFLTILTAGLAATGALSAISNANTAVSRPALNMIPADLLRIAEGAHVTLMRGDMEAYRKLITLSGDFTFMGPFGGETRGSASFTDARWAEIGKAFRNGRDSHFELVQAYYAPKLAVLVGVERTHVEVAGLPAQNWSLRVTLVFKRVAGGWQLAHRHADPLVRTISLSEAAALADDSRGAGAGA